MSPTNSSSVSTGAQARHAARRGDAARRDAPALRLVAEELRDANENREGDTDGNPPRILIVASRAQERTLVRRELTDALAPDTAFAEAGNIWEVLQQAPQCGVVMLAAPLTDVSARTLTELLGRRHPWLPIVVLDPPDAEAQTGPMSV
ncbi:MAG TPA: hypothetical protein VIC06_00440 [Solirubrobacteraceae bacterium]|jgi:hypothetical protein